jgi:hypothetical protein
MASEVPMCRCGYPAISKDCTSTSNPNNGRKFWTCGIRSLDPNHTSGCNYFLPLDGQPWIRKGAAARPNPPSYAYAAATPPACAVTTVGHATTTGMANRAVQFAGEAAALLENTVLESQIEGDTMKKGALILRILTEIKGVLSDLHFIRNCSCVCKAETPGAPPKLRRSNADLAGKATHHRRPFVPPLKNIPKRRGDDPEDLDSDTEVPAAPTTTPEAEDEDTYEESQAL